MSSSSVKPSGLALFTRLSDGDLSLVGREARRLEALGYDGLASQEVSGDPFLPLVAAALTTKHARLLTRAALAFPRSPMVTAYVAWDLQRCSRGRFTLGLATQVKRHNEERFSVRWAPPVDRLREYVQALYAIWEAWQHGTPLEFRGTAYTFTLMPSAFRPSPLPYPMPKVYIGGASTSLARLAGEIADGFLAPGPVTASYLRDVLLPAVREGAHRSGTRAGNVSLNGMCYVVTAPGARLAGAMAAGRRLLAFYAASSAAYADVFRHHGWGELRQRLVELAEAGQSEAAADAITEEVLNAFFVTGEPGEVTERLRQRYEGLVSELTLKVVSDDPRRGLNLLGALAQGVKAR